MDCKYKEKRVEFYLASKRHHLNNSHDQHKLSGVEKEGHRIRSCYKKMKASHLPSFLFFPGHNVLLPGISMCYPQGMGLITFSQTTWEEKKVIKKPTWKYFSSVKKLCYEAHLKAQFARHCNETSSVLLKYKLFVAKGQKNHWQNKN